MDPKPADIDALIGELTLDEKAALTAGADMWSTVAVERLGIPSFKVTDGPSGARGALVPGQESTLSLSIPCGSAIGATWDPSLVEELGHALGREARAKDCRALLAPTVNLHRSPLAGRNFESYGEDPYLSGKLAAAFVRGVQAEGVVTTVKHFAANEAEFERHTISSVVDERPLRELYLVPFELAVREGGALGVMTAYNRLNGTFCAEHRELVTEILRGDWGFEGFVLTDWFATGSTAGSADAGLDLEMPGPARFFGPALASAVRDGTVDEQVLDDQATRLLGAFARIGGIEAGATPVPDSAADRALARDAAAASFVLLENDGLLPFSELPRTLAVIGPNAVRTQIMGGGSAHVRPQHRTSIADALTARLGDRVELRCERGCDIDRAAPPIEAGWLRADGGEGVDVEWFANEDLDGPVVQRTRATETRMLFLGEPFPGLGASFSFRAHAQLTTPETGAYTLTLVEAGTARVLIDGDVVIDGSGDDIARGHEFFGLGSVELPAPVELVAGEPVDLMLEYSSRGSGGLGAVKVGCRAPGSDDDLLAQAVEAAGAADLALVVVGTNDDWESEGHDRVSLALPGRQDELLTRVLAANPNTVVVVNTGAPVDMDAMDGARAVVQGWFGGQEMADALVDVLLGDAEPSGRLPMTIPRRLEDNPSFGNFPGEDGEVRYGEGLLVGYRWYDARKIAPRYAFGSGLSYTTFEIGRPALSSSTFAPGDRLTVEVPVTNRGSRRGAEVVQCYVGALAPARFRPRRVLVAFEKVWLDPGEEATVQLVLDDRSVASWAPNLPGWTIDPGPYEVAIGRSSADLPHVETIEVSDHPSSG